jgi:hypothetical protein
MSHPLKYVHKCIRNPFNDEWEREEFEKRNKDRIFDFEKIKYYIPIQTLNTWKQNLMSIIPVLLSLEDCQTYEEWRACPLICRIMNGKPNQEIDNPHYEKPFEVILKHKYATNAQIKSYMWFHPKYVKPSSLV